MSKQAKGLREPMEITQANAAIAAVLEGDIDLPYTDFDKDCLRIANDVLCWVLCHDHETEFGRVYASLLVNAKRQGDLFYNPDEEVSCHVERLPGRWREEVESGRLRYEHAIEEIRSYHSALYRSYKIGAKACKMCGMFHEKCAPCDPTSPLFRAYTLSITGLIPTWDDALQHCNERLQGRIVAGLVKLGAYPVVKSITPKIARLIRESVQVSKGKKK